MKEITRIIIIIIMIIIIIIIIIIIGLRVRHASSQDLSSNLPECT